MSEHPPEQAAVKPAAADPQPVGVTPPHPAAPVYYQASGAAYYGSYGGDAGYYGNNPGGMLADLSVHRLMRLLRRKWPTLLLVTAFGVACSFFYLYRTPRVYQAYSLIEMSLRKPRILNQQDAVIEDGRASAKEVFNTRLIKFRGAGLLEIAAAKYRELTGDHQLSDANLMATLKKGMEFSMLKDALILRISFTHNNPVFAAHAANACALAAESSIFQENKETSDKAVAWLQAQAISQRDQLAKAEQALLDFRTANNLDVLEGAKKSAEDSLLSLNSSVVALESQILLMTDTYEFMRDATPTSDTAAALPSAIPQAAEVQRILKAKADMRTQREALLRHYTPLHPEVQKLDHEITSLDGELSRNIEAAKSQTASALALLKQQAESLRDKIAEQSGKVTELERRIVESRTRLSSMERERDACDITYRGILKRIEEARLSADENTTILRVLEPAGVPLKPVSPVPLRAIAIGLVAGLMGGLGLSLLTEALDDRVVSADDIERDMGLKIVGVVPHVATKRREQLATATFTEKFSHISEAFAGLRGLLMSAQYRDHTDSILVCSSAPEEGKTISSTNLAVVFAKSGARTLLVDFDLRRPLLARIFQIPRTQPSLLHVLASRQEADFASLPFISPLENLTVITSQPSAELSPAEIMGTPIVGAFMDWAKRHYDRVIIDSPPYGIVSDAAILAGQVGCVIIVCRPEKSRKRAVRHTVRRFREVGANVVGAIVNDVPLGKKSLFGSEGYDHYGYGTQYREPTR